MERTTGRREIEWKPHRKKKEGEEPQGGGKVNTSDSEIVLANLS